MVILLAYSLFLQYLLLFYENIPLLERLFP